MLLKTSRAISYENPSFILFLLISILIVSSLLPFHSGYFKIYAQEDEEESSLSIDCVKYDSIEKTITITCHSANLTDVYNELRNPEILKKETSTPTEAVWLLNAPIIIEKGATLYINSTDTSWLKIIAPDREFASQAGDNEENPISKANAIEIFGSLKIDSVKITSWDLSTNDYAITEGKRILKGNEYEVQLGSPRPFISVKGEATGTTDITNSEIAYLGYEEGIGEGPVVGLTYFGGNGSIIRNNDIHHLYFAFYSNGVRNITIENNRVHDSGQYGIDPHTGTHDIVIRNNIVYDNVGQGIICSVDCYNITIESNKVFGNKGAGIMFSRNMHDSTARNNTVFDETECIFVSGSHSNQIYNNTVSSCSVAGLYLKAGSTNNMLHDNIIMNSKRGILVNQGSSDNIFYRNTVMSNSTQFAISLDNDDDFGKIAERIDNSNADNNTFVENKLVASPEVTIKYPAPGQNVLPGTLTIYGLSSDNATATCQVSVLLNNKEPYQNALGTGPQGNDDYSKWTFTFDPRYSVIQEGVNEIASRIICHSEQDDNGVNPTGYGKINVSALRLEDG